MWKIILFCSIWSYCHESWSWVEEKSLRPITLSCQLLWFRTFYSVPSIHYVFISNKLLIFDQGNLHISNTFDVNWLILWFTFTTYNINLRIKRVYSIPQKTKSARFLTTFELFWITNWIILGLYLSLLVTFLSRNIYPSLMITTLYILENLLSWQQCILNG